MALPKDLKSNMTGIPVEGTEDSVIESVPSPAPVDGVSSDRSIVAPEVAESIPAVPESGNDLLKKVEAQLNGISQLLVTMQAKPSDLQNITESLERIEKQLGSLSGSSANSDKLNALETMIASVVEKLDRNDRQLTQDLRENANFRIQVRQGMQHDLDELKAQQSGEQFNPILKEIATIYSEYQVLLDEELPHRARKNLMALFEQLEDLLADYDAEVFRSEVGSVRQTRSCKIVNKVPTANSELHNTIVASRKPGVVRGRMVLYQELVDVYVYDSTLSIADETTGDSQDAVPVEGTNP